MEFEFILLGGRGGGGFQEEVFVRTFKFIKNEEGTLLIFNHHSIS